MAMEERQDLSPVIERLFNEGYRFNFFQAVYLLDKLYHNSPPPGETGPLDREAIRFHPHTGMGFPPTDICQIQTQKDRQGKEKVEMILSFMGLYGSASPLPNNICQLIATEEEGTLPLRVFLDIFNHRFYSLFYRSWKKYRYYLQFVSEGSDRLSQYMLSLLGLGTPKLADLVGVPSTRLIAYSGIVGQRIHCKEGLQGLLSDYFGGIPVDIQEFIPRWVTIPDQVSLGSKPPLQGEAERIAPAQLGENAVVGKKILDYSGKFRVILGPLTLEMYQGFLPEGAYVKELYALIRFYSPDQLDFDVALRIKEEEVPTPLQLGGELAQLGRTAWLGKPQEDAVPIFSHN